MHIVPVRPKLTWCMDVLKDVFRFKIMTLITFPLFRWLPAVSAETYGALLTRGRGTDMLTYL